MKRILLRNKFQDFFRGKTASTEVAATFSRFFHYVLTNFSTKALGFISMPIMTRLFTVGEYGIFATFGTVVSILSIVMGLNLPQGVLRYYYEEDNSDFQEFVNSVFCLLVLTFSFLLGIWIIYSDFYVAIFGLGKYLVLWALFAGFVFSLFNIVQKTLVAQGKSAVLSKFTITNGLGAFAIALLITYLFRPVRIETFIAGHTIFKLVFALVLVYYLGVNTRPLKIHKAHISYALNYSLPRWLFTASVLLLNQLDRLMLNVMVGSNATGLYSVGYNIGMLITLLILAITPAMTPIYYKSIKEKDFNTIDRLNVTFSVVTLFFALVLILVGPLLLQILVPKSYRQAEVIIPIIVIGYVFHSYSSIYARVFDYTKNAKHLSRISFMALIVNVAFNFILIPRWGFLGAAVSTLVSFFIMFIQLWYFSKYRIKLHTTKLKLLVLPLFVFLAFVAVNFLIAPCLSSFSSILIKLTFLLGFGLIAVMFAKKHWNVR